MSTKNTKVLFIKYHEAADQQPLSKKAAEKLGIFPSLALGGLAAWIRQNGYPVQLIDLHVENLYGLNSHHIVESCYKGLARALRQAIEIDPRQAGAVPSTKGSL